MTSLTLLPLRHIDSPGVELAASPHRRGLRRIRVPRRGLLEIGLLTGLYLLYSLGRTLADQNLAQARGHAQHVLDLETLLHIDVEAWLNASVSSVPWLGIAASIWYASLHYLVTPAVLLWTYAKHRDNYAWARNALGLATIVGLLSYVLVPTAPPRLMGGKWIDTLAHYAKYGWWSNHASAPAGLGGLTDELAAMPSLHVGWAIWVAVVVASLARPGWLPRALGTAYASGTAIVVVATGNHWVLDAAGGALTVILGFAGAATIAKVQNSPDANSSRAPRPTNTNDLGLADS